jgi:hypothetical protein
VRGGEHSCSHEHCREVSFAGLKGWHFFGVKRGEGGEKRGKEEREKGRREEEEERRKKRGGRREGEWKIRYC